MATRNIILELSYSKGRAERAQAALVEPQATLDKSVMPSLDTLDYDERFPVVSLPEVTRREHPEDEFFDTTSTFDFDAGPDVSTYLARGTIEEGALDEFEKEAESNRAVVGYYSDVTIQPMIVCPGSAPVGTDATVESLLCTSQMHRGRMDGRGVLVAIVDTGVNIAYLNSHGKHPTFDAARSWAWDPSVVTPGSAPVSHGTMCAFDVCIAAPACTILDIALLHPISAPPGGSLMEGLLSDAIHAYRHLLSVMTAPRRPGENRSLVVNNSWGMFHPSWDWPVGHPANYSDNPNHPFNRIVATLERAGADILFAAGNCGADCPDGRCQGVTTRTIYGANSSPAVICVAGVDTTKARVGYSAIGPGRLATRKPDLSGYTHFQGSGVYTADGGTSAACPVVSGAVAAVRSKRPFNPSDSTTRPAAIRNLLISTAEDLGPTGYDYLHGHGVINGCELEHRLNPPIIIDLCRRYPWICDRRWWRRIRLPIPIRPPLPEPPIPPRPPGPLSPSSGAEEAVEDADLMQPEEVQQLIEQFMPGLAKEDLSTEQLAYRIGYWLGRQDDEAGQERSRGSSGCACKDR